MRRQLLRVEISVDGVAHLVLGHVVGETEGQSFVGQVDFHDSLLVSKKPLLERGAWYNLASMLGAPSFPVPQTPGPKRGIFVV